MIKQTTETVTVTKTFVDWKEFRLALEEKLGGSIRDYQGVNFWFFWTSTVDLDVHPRCVSDHLVCLEEILEEYQDDSTPVCGDDELVTIHILEVAIEVLGDLASEYIQFKY